MGTGGGEESEEGRGNRENRGSPGGRAAKPWNRMKKRGRRKEGPLTEISKSERCRTLERSCYCHTLPFTLRRRLGGKGHKGGGRESTLS